MAPGSPLFAATSARPPGARGGAGDSCAIHLLDLEHRLNGDVVGAQFLWRVVVEELRDGVVECLEGRLGQPEVTTIGNQREPEERREAAKANVSGGTVCQVRPPIGQRSGVPSEADPPRSGCSATVSDGPPDQRPGLQYSRVGVAGAGACSCLDVTVCRPRRRSPRVRPDACFLARMMRQACRRARGDATACDRIHSDRFEALPAPRFREPHSCCHPSCSPACRGRAHRAGRTEPLVARRAGRRAGGTAGRGRAVMMPDRVGNHQPAVVGPVDMHARSLA